MSEYNIDLKDREFLMELRARAFKLAESDRLQQKQYEDLAHAADVLDAFLARDALWAYQRSRTKGPP